MQSSCKNRAAPRMIPCNTRNRCGGFMDSAGIETEDACSANEKIACRLLRQAIAVFSGLHVLASCRRKVYPAQTKGPGRIFGAARSFTEYRKISPVAAAAVGRVSLLLPRHLPAAHTVPPARKRCSLPSRSCSGCSGRRWCLPAGLSSPRPDR